PTPSPQALGSVTVGNPPPISQELNPVSVMPFSASTPSLGSDRPSIEIGAGEDPFVSGADIYRQMIENYLANNPGGVGVPETAAALLKNIPTGRGYHARQYYEYGGAPGG